MALSLAHALGLEPSIPLIHISLNQQNPFEMEGPVVKTPLGGLQGSIIKTDRGETIYTFLGIPYAKPPVGDLRFKVSKL